MFLSPAYSFRIDSLLGIFPLSKSRYESTFVGKRGKEQAVSSELPEHCAELSQILS